MNTEEFEQRLTTYLELRKALGAEVGEGAKVLENFIIFAGRQSNVRPVTSKLVFDWLETMNAQQSAGSMSRRLVLVRQFLLHLSAAIPETQVPHCGLLTGYKRRMPYLFAPRELEQLLSAAAEFKPGKFCSVVLHTILGLIAATGLRASEALGLDRQDVMPRSNPGTILIRETKFGKTRLVPVHESTAQQLRVYAGHRELLGFSWHTPAFFVSNQRRRLSHKSLGRSFRILVRRIGLRARNGSNEPTLHSLRHSFVVSRLRSWHEAGVDVEARLTHLATYLGHADFGETYWYMTATPELLAAAATGFAAPPNAGGDE